MKTALCFILCVGGAFALAATEDSTALKSLKTLPADAANRLAIIDGHDGAPTPARWHFLIEDPAAEHGVREIVVADREIVADREVSQFATQLTPEDVVGKAAIKIDSDAAARLAQRYATANALPVASMNFQLRKDPLTAVPVWTVTCLDDQATTLATLVVDGRDGRIIAHDGFASAPPPLLKPAVKRALASVNPRDRRPDGGFRESPRELPPVYEGPVDENRRAPARRAEAVRGDRPEPPDPVRGVIEPVRRLLHKLLPF